MTCMMGFNLPVTNVSWNTWTWALDLLMNDCKPWRSRTMPYSLWSIAVTLWVSCQSFPLDTIQNVTPTLLCFSRRSTCGTGLPSPRGLLRLRNRKEWTKIKNIQIIKWLEQKNRMTGTEIKKKQRNEDVHIQVNNTVSTVLVVLLWEIPNYRLWHCFIIFQNMLSAIQNTSTPLA